jgi:hypothetical protein
MTTTTSWSDMFGTSDRPDVDPALAEPHRGSSPYAGSG